MIQSAALSLHLADEVPFDIAIGARPQPGPQLGVLAILWLAADTGEGDHARINDLTEFVRQSYDIAKGRGN
jgi:hypothetical protein